MGKARFFMTVLRHQVPELITQGWHEALEDHDCPSGALAAMNEVPVLMEKEDVCVES